MKKQENKILSPKLDIVFQKLFGEVGSENITKGFLEAFLDKKITEIDLSQNPILKREYTNEKLGILDVIAKINGEERLNIEMQVTRKGEEKERILFYWSKLYTKGIKKGEEYKKLSKTIVILIADFEIKGIEELNIHTKWQIIDETRRKILTDKLEIHIIELPKMKRKENIKEELLDWLSFIENPESERVNKIVEKNESIKEAKEKLKRMSEDEEMQRISEWREKAIMEERALYNSGLEEGLEQGKRELEQKMAEWKEKAIKEERALYNSGLEEGLEQGINQKTEEIVKKMIEKNMNIEDIIQITGVSKEKIEELKNKI